MILDNGQNYYTQCIMYNVIGLPKSLVGTRVVCV